MLTPSQVQKQELVGVGVTDESQEFKADAVIQTNMQWVQQPKIYNATNQR